MARSLDEILVKDSNYSTYWLSQRLRSESILPAECSRCGLSEWQGEPITLELDHVNGVRDDHRLSNLRFLCPNCHALTPTWRGRNVRSF